MVVAVVIVVVITKVGHKIIGNNKARRSRATAWWREHKSRHSGSVNQVGGTNSRVSVSRIPVSAFQEEVENIIGMMVSLKKTKILLIHQ